MQTPDVPQRWSTIKSAVFSTELGWTFITHPKGCRRGIEVLDEHQSPRFLKPQTLLELQGKYRLRNVLALNQTLDFRRWREGLKSPVVRDATSSSPSAEAAPWMPPKSWQPPSSSKANCGTCSRMARQEPGFQNAPSPSLRCPHWQQPAPK